MTDTATEQVESFASFFARHPLQKAFAETYERLSNPRPDAPPWYMNKDMDQINMVNEAIKQDYIEYLRHWTDQYLGY